MRPRRLLRAALVALSAAGTPRPANAETPTYSAYELSVIDAELDRRNAEMDVAPEGKIISRVEIVRLDVLDESDPVPDFFNVFHVTTRERVIRRELLFREGEAFSAARADETARNLRRARQLSLVLIVPFEDGAPDRVRVLVVTKDVWSLRLNSNFEIANGDLNYLLLNPSEENAFGTHASVGGLFILRPSTYSLGLLLSHSRIAGSRLAGSASGSLRFNRETGGTEGSFGNFSYGLPQYSAEQRWAFLTALWWNDGIARVPKRSEEGDVVPFRYRFERYVAGTEVLRSYGRADKLDLSFGVEADRRNYRPRVPAGAEPELTRDFLEDVPLSDVRLSPYVQLRTYENRFLKTIELETLGLQEDYRLGPTTLFRVYPAGTDFGSSRDLLGVDAGVGYSAALGNGLVRAIARSTLEYAAERRHDALVQAALRVASPRLGLGRFVFDAVLDNRYFDYLNRQYAIGGDDRLRGYPSGDPELRGGDRQRGNDALVLNTEFRSAAVDILSAQCGFALFHDAGDAADTLSSLSLQHSVGFGLRVLFPQANRIVFRADWAFPLSSDYDALPGALFVTFGQAFLMPELVPATTSTSFVE